MHWSASSFVVQLIQPRFSGISAQHCQFIRPLDEPDRCSGWPAGWPTAQVAALRSARSGYVLGPVTRPHLALSTPVRWAAFSWRASDKRPPIRRSSRPRWAVSAVAPNRRSCRLPGPPDSRIRMYVSRHRPGPGFARAPARAITQARDGTSLLRLTAVCGHDEGYPRTFSRICFKVRRFSATADLTFGIASGPSSRSEADVGWRSHLLVSFVPPAAASSR
jgi:hypothetical protein